MDLYKRYQIGWQQYLVVFISLSFIPSLLNLGYPLIFDYNTHRLLHLLGAIIFVGNIIVTGIWMLLANKTKSKEVILFASESTYYLDKTLTSSGMILILWNGLIMADSTFGGPFEAGWMRDSLGTFIIIALIWVLLLVPNQGVMQGSVQDAVNSNSDLSDDYYSAFKKWMNGSLFIIVLSILIVILMISKPDH